MPRAVAAARPPALAPRWEGRIGNHVIDLAWTPDGALLAAAEVGGPVRLFDAASGRAAAAVSGHAFGTTSLDWSADGTTLATGGQDGRIRLWGRDGRELACMAAGAPWIGKVAWSGRSPLLAGVAGRLLCVWAADGTTITEFMPFASTISDVVWVPGKDELAAAGYGGFGLYRPGRPEAIRQFEWKGSVLALAWSPTGTWVAGGNQDASVHLWDTGRGEDLHMGGYALKVRELAWSPDGRLLATGGAADVIVWKCSGRGPAGTRPLMLSHHEAPLSQLAWQRRGPLLASGCRDGRIAVWRPGRREAPVATFHVDEPVSRLAWSGNDRSLAVGTGGGRVLVLPAPA